MNKLIAKYKMFLLYIIVNIITSTLNILIYIIFVNIMNKKYIFSNILSWGISIFITFILNKKIVFRNDSNKQKTNIRQIVSFYIVRL